MQKRTTARYCFSFHQCIYYIFFKYLSLFGSLLQNFKFSLMALWKHLDLTIILTILNTKISTHTQTPCPVEWAWYEITTLTNPDSFTLDFRLLHLNEKAGWQPPAERVCVRAISSSLLNIGSACLCLPVEWMYLHANVLNRSWLVTLLDSQTKGHRRKGPKILSS